MATLPIYLYGSDVLRQKAKPVKELDNATIKLIYDMFETMEKAHGIGLAATQVGEIKRVIVMDVTAAEEAKEGEVPESEIKPRENSSKPKRFVLINPEVLHASGSSVIEEGCLSIPDVRSEVARAERVTVRYRNANFEEMTVEASGLLGRVILHEIDHLNGILFIDHISGAKKTLLRAKLRKVKNGEVETSYPVVTAVEV